jgi:hypothetical protein
VLGVKPLGTQLSAQNRFWSVQDRKGAKEDYENKKQKKQKTPWSVSASELYRPSDRRLSAK